MSVPIHRTMNAQVTKRSFSMTAGEKLGFGEVSTLMSRTLRDENATVVGPPDQGVGTPTNTQTRKVMIINKRATLKTSANVKAKVKITYSWG